MTHEKNHEKRFAIHQLYIRSMIRPHHMEYIKLTCGGLSGELVAVKILESVHEVIEEIEEEYQVLKDLGGHPNLPEFKGIYLKQEPQSEDQVWIAMQVCDTSGGHLFLYCAQWNLIKIVFL